MEFQQADRASGRFHNCNYATVIPALRRIFPAVLRERPFVIYDCVQFPRRGWVHRNQLVDRSGTERWLTLPLEKAPQDVLIRDLRFVPNVAEALTERLRPFPLLARDPLSAAPILDALRNVSGCSVDYIVRLLECTVNYLGLRWSVALKLSTHS